VCYVVGRWGGGGARAEAGAGGGATGCGALQGCLLAFPAGARHDPAQDA